MITLTMPWIHGKEFYIVNHLGATMSGMSNNGDVMYATLLQSVLRSSVDKQMCATFFVPPAQGGLLINAHF